MSLSNKTRQTKKELVEAMNKSLGVVTQACKIAGVSRKTFYTHYNSDPDFKKACDEAQEIAIDFVESKLFKQVEIGDTTAIIFYLKTKGKKRGYIQTTEHINKNHSIDDVLDELKKN